MSCVDLMYQFYSPYFPYKSPAEDVQKLGVGSLYESGPGPGYLDSAPGSGSDKDGEVDRPPSPKGSQYLNPNCLLVTYFTGDIAACVDEHFSRALSQPSSYTLDRQTSDSSKAFSRTGEATLMCQRKFPPSFWNSSYQPTPSGSSGGSAFPLGADPYFSTSFYGFPKNWAYYTSQAHTYTHPQSHAFAYSGMDSSRLNSHYGGLMMQSPASRHAHAQYELGKSDAFPTTPASYYSMSRFPGDVTGHLSMESSLPGLDLPIQQTKKELYW